MIRIRIRIRTDRDRGSRTWRVCRAVPAARPRPSRAHWHCSFETRVDVWPDLASLYSVRHCRSRGGMRAAAATTAANACTCACQWPRGCYYSLQCTHSVLYCSLLSAGECDRRVVHHASHGRDSRAQATVSAATKLKHVHAYVYDSSSSYCSTVVVRAQGSTCTSATRRGTPPSHANARWLELGVQATPPCCSSLTSICALSSIPSCAARAESAGAGLERGGGASAC